MLTVTYLLYISPNNFLRAQGTLPSEALSPDTSRIQDFRVMTVLRNVSLFK